MPQKIKIEDVVAEFNRPVLLNEHGCWLWMGATDRGYARFDSKLVYPIVCRWAGLECIGEMELCHKCPNKNCINPDHFYVGTHKQNMTDDNRLVMGPKGRLTKEQIDEINLMLVRGVKKSTVAYLFGVSPQWISKFIRGEFAYAKYSRTPV